MSISQKRLIPAIVLTTLISLACSDVPTSSVGSGMSVRLAEARQVFLPTSVSISPSSPLIIVGHTAQLLATVKDKRGKLVTDVPVAWWSSDPTIATVSPGGNGNGLAGGNVTAIAAGTVTITASAGLIDGTTLVTVVSQPPAPVATVVVGFSVDPMRIGQIGLATALLRDAAGNIVVGRPISWTTSDPGVATVSATGDLYAVAAGTTQITATSEGVSGSATLTVSAAVPARVAFVSVALAPALLTIGQTSQATAVTRDASNNVLTGRIIAWTSSVPSVATVSSTGLVTASSVGATIITAVSEGVSGAASMAVIAPPPGTSPEPGAGDVVLWQDNFDSRTDFSGYATAGVISLVGGRGGAGKAARFSYSPGNDDNLIEKGFPAASDIYFRFWYRITPPGALPYAGRTGSGIKWFMPWRAVGYRYTCGASLLDGGPAGFTNTGWEFGCHDNTSVRQPNPFVQNVDKSRKYSTTNDGNWHKYTLRIVVGNGGYEQIWIDGVLVSNSQSYAYDHSSEGISMVQLPGLVVDGIPSTAWNFAIDVDDLAIWHK